MASPPGCSAGAATARRRGGATGTGGTNAATGGQGGTGATATGTVTDVGRVASASSGVASYPVTITFDAPASQFFVGATVTGAIDVQTVKNAVQVPSRAVTTDANGQVDGRRRDRRHDDRPAPDRRRDHRCRLGWTDADRERAARR